MADVDLKACIGGDKEAWDAFVDRYSGVIFSAVERTVGGRGHGVNRSDVEDSTQEVFVRLVRDGFRLLRSYDPRQASLVTWLSLVARSAAIDHLRKRRLEAVSLASDSPEHLAAARPQRAEPRSLPLHLLSARQRLILRMLFDEGMSVVETARMIGVNEQTIRSTKHKALSRLREHLMPGPAEDSRGCRPADTRITGDG